MSSPPTKQNGAPPPQQHPAREEKFDPHQVTSQQRQLSGPTVADALPAARRTMAGKVTCLPVPSLTTALDHLDAVGLCCCWTAPYRRRCKAWRWSR